MNYFSIFPEKYSSGITANIIANNDFVIKSQIYEVLSPRFAGKAVRRLESDFCSGIIFRVYLEVWK